MPDLKQIAKEVTRVAADNAGVAPEILFPKILFVLECHLEEETWTITCRRRWPERISFALSLLFSWPVDLGRPR
jgi:hypothetical protein